ncbi:MAG: TlpA family protein disulfide reductase [Bacteroidetes bacterium]|nr:MAG: TlpA family protein disulfide reductase [Bacteroidota bacterium]
MKKLSLMVWLMAALGALNAQHVEVLDFPAFEQRLKTHSDTLFVYNFWATWCRPCVKEMPYFEQLNQEFAHKKVKVVFVSLDFPDQLERLVQPFVEKKNIQSEVVLLNAPNYNEWIDKVSPKWTGSIPATLLSMPAKGIHDFKEQAFEYEELSQWVSSTLNKLHP